MKHSLLLTSLLVCAASSYASMNTSAPQNFNYQCQFQDILLCARMAALEVEKMQVDALVKEAQKKKNALNTIALGQGMHIINDHKPTLEEIEKFYKEGYIMLIDNEYYIFCDAVAVENKALVIAICRQAGQKK